MKKTILAAVIAAISFSSFASSSADVDNYHSQLANLQFKDDYPTADTSAALTKELTFQRATQAYLWALPAANMNAMKEGHEALFKAKGYNHMGVYEKRLKPNTLITTPNSDVIYGLSWADLSNGPMVIDAPVGMQALLDDMWHRPLVGPKQADGTPYLGDIGLPGPDKGKGGKYLLIGPNADRSQFDSSKYFIYQSQTNHVFVFLRSFFKDQSNVKPAVDSLEKIKIYPLEGKKEPMKFHHLSDVPGNSVAPHDWRYFKLVDDVVQSEPYEKVDPYMNGVLASLGIMKGHKFDPTDAQKEMLTKAAQTGWKMAKNIAANFDQDKTLNIYDNSKSVFWKNRKWVAHGLIHDGDLVHTIVDPNYNDKKSGSTVVDAKAHMYINHYSISSRMLQAEVGIGAKYANAYKDSQGNYLNGSCTYKLVLPKDVPAKLFWSVTAYDASTAAGVKGTGTYPSIGDCDKPVQNADGSTTLYFGPKVVKGFDKNYVNTPEHKGWFGLIRLYAPAEGVFDYSWRPGDFEKVSCDK